MHFLCPSAESRFDVLKKEFLGICISINPGWMRWRETTDHSRNGRRIGGVVKQICLEHILRKWWRSVGRLVVLESFHQEKSCLDGFQFILFILLFYRVSNSSPVTTFPLDSFNVDGAHTIK